MTETAALLTLFAMARRGPSRFGTFCARAKRTDSQGENENRDSVTCPRLPSRSDGARLDLASARPRLDFFLSLQEYVDGDFWRAEAAARES
jgi:hypothetical protein